MSGGARKILRWFSTKKSRKEGGIFESVKSEKSRQLSELYLI